MRPPRITLCVVVGVPVAGQTVSVQVDWTAVPEGAARYQWRNGQAILPDATGAAYTLPVAMPDLNCTVEVDNGVGTAMAVALPTVVPAPPVDPEDPEAPVESTFVPGTYVAGVYV